MEQAMLDHEYKLLNERLGESRGATSAFFAFANTVAARSFSQQEDGHGWQYWRKYAMENPTGRAWCRRK